MTKIGIVSDIHSAVTPLQQALSVFKQQGVSQIICAGDVAGYGEDSLDEVIKLLKQNNCITVQGNHDEPAELTSENQCSIAARQYLQTLPQAISLFIENKHIFIVHAHPPDQQHGGIKLLDQQGDVIASQRDLWRNKLKNFHYDVLIVGHTHQVFAELLAQTLVLNPGSSLFNHSCMVLSLPDMKTEIFELGQAVIRSWNWGLFYQQHP